MLPSSVTPWDLEVWARTLWGEARGEGRTGMSAVAHVILNRANDSARRWPLSIAGVCLQRLQFSCWNGDDPNRAQMATVTLADPAYFQATAVCWEALAGPDDLTGGATHYLATALLTRGQAPSWADPARQVRVIGGHSFYRL